jgi:hypothetical protein
MVLIPALALGGISLAKLVSVGVLVSMLAVFARVIPTAGLWPALLFLSAGTVMDVCWQGKNDIMAALSVLVAAWCAMESMNGRRRWLLCAAWFMGQALAAKLTAGMAVAGVAAAGAGFGLCRGMRMKAGLGVAVASFLPLSGWFLASWLFLGNPAHPFLSGIFPDIGWNTFLNEALYVHDDALRPLEARSRWDLLAGVWRSFGDPDLGSIGLFALLPVAFFRFRGGASTASLKAAVIIAYVLWMPMGIERNPRYLFPLLPVVALLGGGFLVGIPGRGRSVLAVTVVVFALGHATLRFLSPRGWLYIFSQVSEREFLAGRYTTWEDARTWINGNLPAAARINISGDDRQFGVERRVHGYGAVVEPLFWRLTGESRTTGEIAKRLRQRGITHHLHNAVGAVFKGLFFFPGPAWTDRQLKLFAEFVRGRFRPVYVPDRVDRVNGGYYVFEIMTVPGKSGYPVMFLPFTEGRLREAWFLTQAGRFREALASAERAAAPAPDVMQFDLALATIHSRLGDHAKAMELLRPGIEAGFVSTWDTWNLSVYAAAAVNSGRYEEGVRGFERSVRVIDDAELFPSLGRALVGRGQDREVRGNTPAALADLRRGLPLLKDPGMRVQVKAKIAYLEVGGRR